MYDYALKPSELQDMRGSLDGWEDLAPENVEEINIDYQPRPFQTILHNELRRFNVLVCHRRFGKTVFSIMEMIDRGVRNELKNPQYAYIAPTYGQAKRVAWQYLKDYCASFPGAKANEAELRIDIPRDREDGKRDRIRFMLLGAENPDGLRGLYLDGAILDEYAQCPPALWSEVIRAALSDREGWAIFIGTPKGTNHFFEQLQLAQRLQQSGDEWYTAVLPVSLTKVISSRELESIKREISPEEYEQEYEVSFTAALKGAYYGEYINKMDADGRILDFDVDRLYPVRTAWDLGISDSMSIWLYQIVGREVRIIDYIEDSGRGLEFYVSELQSKGYLLDQNGHALPHDGAARELGSGKSRQEMLELLGLRCHILPRQSVADGIHAARTLIGRPNVFIHKSNCRRGIDALRNYTRKYDRIKGIFLDSPNHNWASHGADAFRYLALDLDDPQASIMNISPKHRQVVSQYDEFGDF